MKVRMTMAWVILWGLAAARLAGQAPVVPAGPEEKFCQAALAGREAEVAAMLAADPGLASAKDQHGISALMLAVYGDRAAVVRLILARRQDDLSVFEAAALGRDEVLEAVLRQDPGQARAFGPDGFTALHLASFFGHPRAQELLLRAGAEVDAYSRNKFHAAPLQSAAAARQLEAARVLLLHGADPNCRGEGSYTPLHEAAATGQVELVRLLLSYKADVTARGDDGKTPWELASPQSAVRQLLGKEGK
ncbi:MAG TPA: ankyrin repeat domain-containing protein [Terriglobales bacterium]|jgi:ankyrin repeat protein|nr:ankyrin repeat domain-containing protein [Terriglobales bacterium]